MNSEMETDSPNPKKCSNGENESSLTPKQVTFNRMKDCLTDDINWVNASDITIIVNNQKLSAHKNVLAINSDYFDKMFASSFKERDKDSIEINIIDVSFETLKTLFDLFYTSKLVITELNVQDLLIGANLLLLEDVQDACVDYLKSRINVGNCINMKDLANSLRLTDLYSLCLTFIINNFRFVANAEEFMTVSYDEIMIFIQNDNLFAKEEMIGPSGSKCYNPKLNSWKSIAQLPEKNEGSAICTLNNNMYVIGGHGNDNFFKSVWTYYTETNEWVPVADLNTPRSQSGVVVMNGCIFVFGGKTLDKSYSNTFEVYNPHVDEWIISNATMNIGRCNIDAIVIEKSCSLFEKVFEEATNIIHYSFT